VLFDLQRRERDGWTVLAVVGELDLSAVARVRPAVQQALSSAGRPGTEPLRVVVDLSACHFVDSAGLGVVLGVVRRVRQGGGAAAVVVDPASPVAGVFSLLGLDRVIPVTASLDEVVDRARAGALEPVGAPVEPALAGETGGVDG
jgi:anti-sigma B factor antagonist